MNAPGRRLLKVTTSSVVCLATTITAVAGVPATQDFEADEALETVTVRIDVAAEGENLAEPVYLDLGLGFPFWLHPLGRDESARAPAGVTPTRADAAHEVPAGASATFTFGATEDSDADSFRTAHVLLDDVRVSDISRVGFASPGDVGWVLAGYEVLINDKPLAANNAVNAAVSEAHDAAYTRLSEIAEQLEPLTTEAGDLRAMVEAGFPLDDADSARLAELNGQLRPLLEEQNRLQRTVDGSHPWFVAADFESPWRGDAMIREAKVTLVTAAHTGADTSNFVFFHAGGHKYVVSSPMNRLLPDYGPQEIRLDLLAGPLVVGDLRGYSVSMLAHDQPPYATAPDRWHPQRIIVELDGRIVYDSDENDIDHMSLEAIRIIPPAHLDPDGNVIVNAAGPRETQIWQAGQAAGLDLVRGGALELPPESDPAYPEAEAGLADESFDAPYPLPVPDVGADVAVRDEEFCPGFDPGFAPFPGEEYFGPGWAPAEPWLDPYWDPGFDPWLDPEIVPLDPAYMPWAPPPGWMSLLFDLLSRSGVDVDVIAEIIEEEMEEIEADPVGDPVQIDDIRWEVMADAASGLVIPTGLSWTVSGDDSSVAGYDVQVLAFRPHLAPPANIGEELFFQSTGPATTVGIGLDVLDDWMTAPRPDRDLIYLLPLVTPRLGEGADPGATEPGRFGPARAMHPSSPLLSPITMHFTYDDGAALGFDEVSFSGEPAFRRAVWLPSVAETHIGGFVFDAATPGFHMVLRPEVGDEMLRFDQFVSTMPIAGRWRTVAHVGFLDGTTDVANHAEVMIAANLQPDGGGPVVAIDTAWVEVLTAPDAAQPLVPLELEMDPAAFGGVPYNVQSMNLLIRGGDHTEAHPPVFIGLRMFPVVD